MLQREFCLWGLDDPVEHHDDRCEVVDDEVDPGDHSAVDTAEQDAEGETGGSYGCNGSATDDLSGFGRLFAADEVGCSCDQDDGREEIGENGEEAEEIDYAGALRNCVEERGCQRREGEEAEEETCGS